MSIFGAAMRGFGAAFGSPRLVIGLWLVNLVVALPVAGLMGASIGNSVGGSLVGEKLRDGFDIYWFGEYREEAKGIETSFTPTVTGAGAFYDNLEAWSDGSLYSEHLPLVGVGILYGLLWSFLMGGVLDRFARPSESAVRARFAQASGIYFFRFLRLALISGVFYLLIFWLHRRMFDWLESLTRDMTREWSVLWVSLGVYLLTAFLLTFVHMSFGYAKIATVVENRRVMLLAAARGLGFVLSFPGKTFGLYYGLLAIGAIVLALYSVVAPGAGQTNYLTIFLAFLVGQLFLVAKLVMRLTLYGAQINFFKALASR